MKKIILIATAMVIIVYLLCLADEKQPSHKPEGNDLSFAASAKKEGLPSENWKVYNSLVGIWPQLKKEEIESIRFCDTLNLEYGYDNESEFWRKDPSIFREKAASVVRWWLTIYKVPDERLPECIEIINKAIKNAKEPNVQIWVSKRMLIVTKNGKYIIPVRIDPLYKVVVQGREWESHELGEFIVKYCIQTYKRVYYVPPKEQTVAILIFSQRNRNEIKSHDSLLVWPPIALFGDKKEAEELLGRSFEPKMVFEGRDWLEKIITEYEIALEGAEETHYRRNDGYSLKGWIVFLTQDEFYEKGIGIDDDTVIDDYIKGSKPLKTY